MRECPECGRLYPDAETACPHDGRLLALDSAHEVDPHLGRTVGSYILVQKLGSGGMGDVYLGEHPQIGSRVAIKLLNARFAADTVIVERFFNEARAANLIGHENIVQIFDFGRLSEGIPYFVMEWLPGEPLSSRMGAPVAINDAIPIVVQITAALAAAHDAGIVHRDLKPDNIFLVRRQHGVHVKLLDFGIAKLNGVVPKAGTTASGVVMGTARYLSPEQAAGDAAHVSAASDIYSLGVILYQLTTGQLPFTRETYAEMLTAHLRESPRSPRELNPALPRQLEAVILRCLEKKAGEPLHLDARVGAVLQPGHESSSRIKAGSVAMADRLGCACSDNGARSGRLELVPLARGFATIRSNRQSAPLSAATASRRAIPHTGTSNGDPVGR